MSNTTPNSPLQVFHGAVQAATYRHQRVPSYMGNPLIEALPDIRSSEDAAKLMAYHPKHNPNGRRLPPEIRVHMVQDAMHFFEPLPVHVDLEQRIARMIRDGYTGRNPQARQHWQELDQRVEAILQSGGIPLRTSAASGFSIIGLPGDGKTLTVERILQLYPQILEHASYRARPLSRIQIVWLKLTCPFDASIKGLCLAFFQAVDDLLGTDYYRNYAGGGRRTVDDLIPAMARVAWIHCLGMLAIDEVQHLNHAKSGGADRMLSFFLQLINTLGLPVLLIGTYAALPVLSRELRQIRRSSGLGDLIWERMTNDEVWRLLIEALWRYQYVRTPAPLTQDLLDVLYDESQGITDFAVKIFVLAQVRAIVTGVETITKGLIRSVAHDSLRLARPVLQALRTGNKAALATMSDIHPIDIRSAIHEMQFAKLARSLGPKTEITSGNTPHSDIVANPAGLAAKAPATTNNLVRSKSRKPTKATDDSRCLLVQIAQAGSKKRKSAHDSLASAGLIKAMFGSSETPAIG